ncbi:MAG: DUF456 domain-containing protein, partial [Deltaproteobacteria bacterium]|nr:DUF456 domain-containing protein [Deltaproteobacteria bacterium]
MTLLIVFGLFLSLVGLIGCVLPVIPRPPLSFLALLFLSYAKIWEPFSLTFLVIMAALTVVVSIMDYVI